MTDTFSTDNFRPTMVNIEQHVMSYHAKKHGVVWIVYTNIEIGVFVWTGWIEFLGPQEPSEYLTMIEIRECLWRAWESFKA